MNYSLLFYPPLGMLKSQMPLPILSNRSFCLRGCTPNHDQVDEFSKSKDNSESFVRLWFRLEAPVSIMGRVTT